ncbi:hypothetical protein BH23PSE2_BH23PSE2_11930 [soil metagenome]
MSRPILRLLLLLPIVLLAATPLHARSLGANIARVTTPVAILHDVQVRLDWAPGAARGELQLRAARVDAADLGYRFRRLDWRCPLARDGRGGWRCEGELRAAGGPPLRLAVDLASASTDMVLSRGPSRLALRRNAATPDLTTLDLTRVPLAWAQALAAQAWADGRLQAGSLGGRVTVRTPKGGPLRVGAALTLAGGALETPDGRIAAEHLDGRFDIDYHRFGDTTRVAVDGTLHGGELLYGNTYVALADAPVAIAVDALRRGNDGWQLPRFSWDDGRALRASGSGAYTANGDLADLDLSLRSQEAASLPVRYLSGVLGLAGLGRLESRGALDVDLRIREAKVESFEARLQEVALRDPDGRFRFEGLDGTVRFSSRGAVDSSLQWRNGGVGDIGFGAAVLPMRSADGALRLRESVTIPVLDGRLTIESLMLRPPAGQRGLEVEAGLALEDLQLAALAQALGGPAFRGTLSGHIPMARYADDRLVFDGGLTMDVFDGAVRVSALSMERPFGVAPTLSADLDLEDLDLLAITEVFDFGSITGRLDGRIHGLRLVDWSATAFDADLRTVRRAGLRQRISQRAVQNISSVGDASFVSSLQGQLIGIFDDFGYRRIGISCRLVNTVCTMGGLRSAGEGFTIVEGSGIPRLDVVGFNRRVDWPILVERLAAVGKGEVKPVFD